MYHLDGFDLNAFDFEGYARLDYVDVESGDSEIGMFDKAIGHAGADVVGNILTAVYGERFAVAVRPQVVEAAYMVVVYVGDKQSIEMWRAGGNHLLTEVGSAVDKYVFVLNFNQGRGSQASVARVDRGAGLAFAPYLRDAGRGTGT